MRNALISTIVIFSSFAVLGCAEKLSPFHLPSLETTIAIDNETISDLELVKRQTSCASGYDSCANLGNGGLCCAPRQLCALDQLGRIGCCPEGSVCTGTLPAGAATATTTGAGPTIGSTTTTTQNFVTAQQTGAASRSTVPNAYYPFAYIPTTYTNAAACSSAYTSCQTEAASCTAALAGGVNGVTVVAPNGGVTVQPITARLESAAASSVCSSLSLAACSGLIVEACQAFGTGTGNGAVRRGDCRGAVYGAGAGIAIGMAGQLI